MTRSVNSHCISYYLPEAILTNDELASLYKEWTSDKIYEKTGIRNRHIAYENEFVSDLAVKASKNLFEEYSITPEDIDFVILATQTPDYLLPTTACTVQERLGIPKMSGALDINLGCSAFIYGLAVAKSLVQSQISQNVLLIMAETYSKHIHPMDKSVRTIFGDGAAAALVNSDNANKIGNFVLGTDGSKAESLIIPASGAKRQKSQDTKVEFTDENGCIRTKENLYMNGTEIFNFTIKVIPETVKQTLERNNISLEEIDLFVFHQANKYILEYLRKKIGIHEDKFYVNLYETGNTVSASIPIALKMAENENKLKKGYKIMLVGFGVGLSWGATVIEW
jgi:3-oxoacyl-[acyl-carrier-protein] synthase-3